MSRDEKFHLTGPQMLKFWDEARKVLQAILAQEVTLDDAVRGFKRILKEAKDAREATPPPRN